MIWARWGAALGVAALVASALPACTATANVTEVWTSLDSDGSRRRNEFFTDTKEIHCIAEAGIGRDNVTLEGFIRQTQAYDFDRNAFVQVDRVLAYAETRAERSAQAFKFDIQLLKGDGSGQQLANAPYQAGRYVCEVRLDGAIEGTAIFNIDFPPCPPAVILDGQVCFGFYRQNDLCPQAGESGQQDPKCSCTIGRGWECPR